LSEAAAGPEALVGDRRAQPEPTLASSALGRRWDLDGMLEPAATWATLKAVLHSAQTVEERRFRVDLGEGRGRYASAAKLRLFDAPDGHEPRLVVYKDTASWCPYCHKVMIYLEEKRIPYRIEKVNLFCYGAKDPDFLKLQPSGQLPAALIDGLFYGNTEDIVEAVEAAFTDAAHPPLSGDNPVLAASQKKVRAKEEPPFFIRPSFFRDVRMSSSISFIFRSLLPLPPRPFVALSSCFPRSSSSSSSLSSLVVKTPSPPRPTRLAPPTPRLDTAPVRRSLAAVADVGRRGWAAAGQVRGAARGDRGLPGGALLPRARLHHPRRWLLSLSRPGRRVAVLLQGLHV
jgi:glutaredoxin